ncbi:wd and tetratricopeptide repeat protein [Geopyxis carbonaria]|nr:wd and tetratricopeptide repeat protein [Geopyxis carbonaria]
MRPTTLDQRLLQRELTGGRGNSSSKVFYGCREWVDDLDIVGELRGHDGCVNALSWSQDGTLLASGSDDHRVNIYRADAGFSLNTQIETGHTENIFSVKFMPYSSDRKIISAAGDAQVRIFDIEYAPTTHASLSQPALSPQPATGYRRRARQTVMQPTPGKIHQNASRVYTSHQESVKRIVTENSPNLFLTCSEDGTVRQFDLRQPSTTYTRPSPTNGRRPIYFGMTVSDEDDERNPPLISYRKHQIDLNTISCSPSQPHYIAVGGAHLHCFLHDRRMLGRDRDDEMGRRRSPMASASDDIKLTAATQCVRRFSPKMGEDWDTKIHNSHITACKISDANPNEILVSWSGNGAYLFDINRSPEPNEPGQGRDPWKPATKGSKTKAEKSSRKRRRTHSPSEASDSTAGNIAPGQGMMRLAGLVVDIKRDMFGLASSDLVADRDPVAERLKSYEAALRTSSAALKRMNTAIESLYNQDLEFFDDIMGRNSSTVRTERVHRATLAKNRLKARNFVHSTERLARALGASIEGVDYPGLFRPSVGGSNSFEDQFLNTIIYWLSSGNAGIAELAKEHHIDSLESSENEEDGSPPTSTAMIDEYFAHMERCAIDVIVRDVDTSEEIFESQKDMVIALRGVVQEEIGGTGTAPGPARRFWGERVGRSLLKKEGEGINFAFVETAFKGPEETGDGEGSAANAEAELDVGRIVEQINADLNNDNDTTMTDDDDEYDDDDYVGDDDDEDGLDEDEDDDLDEDGDDDMADYDDSDDDADFWYRRRRRGRRPVEPQAPIWEHTKVYRGHCNVRTVKDINFYGLNDEYVVSGSDCGHVFIWDKKTTKIVQLLQGDEDTVNVITGHPYEPLMAVSGIDHTVKLFSPDRVMQHEFGAAGTDEDINPQRNTMEYSGRVSRRQMLHMHGITSQNQMMNESGVPGAVFTVRLSLIGLSFAQWQSLEP